MTDWAAELLGGRDSLERWPAPSGLGADEEPVTVVALFAEAPDAVTLRLARSRSTGFLPGQHIVVRVPTGDRFPALESYSIASSPWPDPSVIEITVKEVPGGRVSPLLVRRIPVGATLAVEGPFGFFTWTEDDGGPVALVGAGSGIVPLMAIIRYVAAKDLSVPVRLLHSSADRDHSIYHDELTRLAAAHPWLDVVRSFTRDQVDSAARYHRRIDRLMLSEVFAPMAEACVAYVCGPPSMVRVVEDGLTFLGVKPGWLNTDEWE